MHRLLAICLLGLTSTLHAAPPKEVLPEVPNLHFADYVGVVSPQTALRLSHTLEDYERSSSNQLMVAIYPTMESRSSIEDYTVRLAEKWGVGQADKDNGAVLFVFIRDRKMFLQVGYGLEAKLTDAESKNIIDSLKSYFRVSNFDKGFDLAVTKMIAATEGEFTGTGKTEAEHDNLGSSWVPVMIVLLFLGIIVFNVIRRAATGRSYTDRGTTIYRENTGWTFGSGSSSGSWGSSGGGGFSSGGGSFGGGGAGGSW